MRASSDSPGALPIRRCSLVCDAINLLNKPIQGTPNLNIDSTSFGQITTAIGNRMVNLMVRVAF